MTDEDEWLELHPFCGSRGPVPGVVLVSPDVDDAISRGERPEGWIEIGYVYLEEELERMVVSESFARKWNIAERGLVPLPDQYPAWGAELLPQCARCWTVARGDGSQGRPIRSELPAG